MNILKQSCVAGVQKAFEFPGLALGWRIALADPAATLVLEFENSGSKTVAKKGLYGRLPKTFAWVKVTSDVTCEVTIEWSEDGAITFDFPDLSFRGAASVTGQYQNLTLVPFDASTLRLFSTGMLKYDDASGNSKSLPFAPPVNQAADFLTGRYEEAVGFNTFIANLSVNANTVGGRSCSGYASARLILSGVWSGPATLYDATGTNPLPYTLPSGAYVKSGVIPSGFTGGLFVDCAATGTIVINRGAGLGAMVVDLFMERMSGLPRPNEKQFAIYTGAAGAGLFTNVVPGVAGYKIRVFGYNLSLSAANDVQFFATDGGGSTGISGKGYAVDGGSEVDLPVFETGSGQQLDIWFLAAAVFSVQVRFQYVPA